MKRRRVALVLAFASACATPPAVPAPVPPLTTSTPRPNVRGPLFSRPESGESARNGEADAGMEDAARPRVPPPEPSFGAGPIKPGDVHAFRLVAAVRAMRANPSGAKILQMLSTVPAVTEAKTRTGVDPFADGEWFLVYGPQVGVPGANANVVRHTRPEADVTKTLADAGFDARDAGGVHAELFGVRDVLLRPQPATLALVPADRATDLGAVLAKPIDSGVKTGELARIFIAEPAKLARMLPPDVLRANVILKPHADGGLDFASDSDCGDAATCTATATALRELVTRQNSMMVRFATRSLFTGLAIRADGTKLRTTLHATPDQVDAILGLVRAQLDLPAPPAASGATVP